MEGEYNYGVWPSTGLEGSGQQEHFSLMGLSLLWHVEAEPSHINWRRVPGGTSSNNPDPI